MEAHYHRWSGQGRVLPAGQAGVRFVCFVVPGFGSISERSSRCSVIIKNFSQPTAEELRYGEVYGCDLSCSDLFGVAQKVAVNPDLRHYLRAQTCCVIFCLVLVGHCQ